MAQVNQKINGSGPITHEGGPAITPKAAIDKLQRTVLACLLFEDNFYEDGVTVAERIKQLVPMCSPEEVSALAVEARNRHRLRHAPLYLARELARHPAIEPRNAKLISQTIGSVIQRADELSEFVALYWMEGKQPLSKQVKKGLANAFTKFDGYQLAKYDRPRDVRLRDVLFLSHAKPKDKAQEVLWKHLVDGTLKPADTWETNLSAGEDKKGTFTRLLHEKKLGYMALLRNLRNMEQAGVDRYLIEQALLDGAKRSKALPFRFISAINAAPSFAPVLDTAMQDAMQEMEKLPGRTTVLVDVSGSMNWAGVSKKSELTRKDAAVALAILATGVCEHARVLTFANEVVEVPAYKGLALKEAINRVPSGGTYLGGAVEYAKQHAPCDRLIVFTDEQTHDRVGSPGCRGYMINVATYQNGVGFGDWNRINGFSEAVIGYIREIEAAGLDA